jgi:hypothetical protein
LHALYLPNWIVHATESGYFDQDPKLDHACHREWIL